MASITTWTRLEPNARTNDLSLGIQARVHDPLWLLTRQWQFGEFAGEDAGSPIQARLRASSNRLLRYHAGRPRDDAAENSVKLPKDMPLEVVVESERAPAGGDIRTRVQLGLLFLKMLSRARLARYRESFVDAFAFDASSLPAELDPGARGFAAVANGRAPDSAALARALRAFVSSGAAPERVSIESDDRDVVKTIAESWLATVKDLVTEPPRDRSAWNPERLEYSFAVSSALPSGEVVLTADEYQEGHLDWYSFSAAGDLSLGGDDEREPDRIARTVIPTSVTFKGMPASRWWEFEDARVDLGSLSTSGGDLAHMLLAQFALLYGNDWYVIPIDLAVGTISHVDSLVVTDTFGVRSLVRRTGRDDRTGAWQAFTITSEGRSNVDVANCLLLAPALASRLDARPNEQVWLVRDEGANTAWGIETIIESIIGRPIERREEPLWRIRAPVERTGAGDADLIYKLATEVPDHWIALVPVRTEGGDGRAIHFERADLVPPEGRLLEPDRTLRIPEEEIPRAGARVERGYQFARWHGGRSHLWMGRRKTTGRGEASSGLRFDATIKASRRESS